MQLNLRLIHSKHAFRLEHLTELEQQLWIEHIERESFEVEDPRSLFEPFEGESCEFADEEISTQDLRVRTWIWTDAEGKEHTLLDMNHWPGDNESGIVTLDGTAIFTNSDQSLYPIEESKIFDSGFHQYHELFTHIRMSLDEGYECEDDLGIYADFTQFVTSEAGKAAVRIDNEAHAQYEHAIQAIEDEHKRLQQLYLAEFTVTDVVTDAVKIAEVAQQIGCVKTTDIVRLVFVSWNDVRSVAVMKFHNSKVFILNPDGRIGRQIYHDAYLVPGMDPSDPLAIRIYAHHRAMIDVICPSFDQIMNSMCKMFPTS